MPQPNPPFHHDLCWIAHTTGSQIEAEIRLISDIARQGGYSCCLALIGKTPASPLALPPEVRVVHAGEPRHRWDLLHPAAPVGDELTFGILRILRQWQEPMSIADEAGLLRALSHLLIEAGAGLRVSCLWRQPEVIRSYIELHERRHPRGSCVDSILVANDLLEVLSQTALFVGDLPPAKIYHSLRSAYCGFVGAIAAERNRSVFVHSAGLDANDDAGPFWLQTLPHHWYGSLLDSRVYHMAGARALALAKEIIEQTAGKILTPFPRKTADEKRVSVAPGLDVSMAILPKSKRASGQVSIGWLVDTASLESLELLAKVAGVARLTSGRLTYRILEASPERRRWVIDAEDWAGAHYLPKQSIAGIRSFSSRELPEIDFLIADGSSESALWSTLQVMGEGMPVILANEATRRLFQGGDYEAEAPGASTAEQLADAIITLAPDREKLTRLGQAARRAVHANFSQAQAVQSHQEIYRKLLAEQIAV